MMIEGLTNGDMVKVEVEKDVWLRGKFIEYSDNKNFPYLVFVSLMKELLYIKHLFPGDLDINELYG